MIEAWTTFATLRRTFTLERTWTISRRRRRIVLKHCRQVRSNLSPALIRSREIRLYARVKRPVWQFARTITTSITACKNESIRRRRRLNDDADEKQDPSLFSSTFLQLPLFTRFRGVSPLRARFSHGALHPLHVGEACEWRTLDYSFLTRAKKLDAPVVAQYLKKTMREYFYKWIARVKASAMTAHPNDDYICTRRAAIFYLIQFYCSFKLESRAIDVIKSKVVWSMERLYSRNTRRITQNSFKTVM